MTFVQEASGTTYTGTLVIPAGAVIQHLVLRNTALWDGTSAIIDVGDDDDPDGYFSATDLKTTPLADVNGAGGQNPTGAYSTGINKLYATEQTLTATITHSGDGSTGRSYLMVVYTVPETIEVQNS